MRSCLFGEEACLLIEARYAIPCCLSLSDNDLEPLQASLERVELPKGFLIVGPDQPIEFAYFPEQGIGSVIAMTPDGQQAEAGLFGRDGFAPIAVALGADRSPQRHIIQVEGAGYRIETRRLVEALENSRAMHQLFLRYVQVSVIQSAFTSLSNAVHPVDERLARWILMCHDRVDGDALALTHEFISIMLAVRRSSVTTSLHVLEGNGFIQSERGLLVVRDRKALEEFAGDAYGKPEAEYRRLIGRSVRQVSPTTPA